MKHYFDAQRAKKLRGNNTSSKEPDLVLALGELFANVVHQRRRVGSLTPRSFVNTLRKSNELFSTLMQQDAHEFFHYLINTVLETVKATGPGPTWVQDLFQGIMINETKCLSCETSTTRDETFLDLSVDVFENSSITHCLRKFSATETLKAEDKFYCEKCCSLQEAEKRMRIKKAPKILALQLKRFKYSEDYGAFRKLSFRVAFPLELRLVNTTEEGDADLLYELYAIVVHVGSAPTHGHYYCVVKSHGAWIIMDDSRVSSIPAYNLSSYFGSASPYSPQSNTGYILFYRAAHAELGFSPPLPPQLAEEITRAASPDPAHSHTHTHTTHTPNPLANEHQAASPPPHPHPHPHPHSHPQPHAHHTRTPADCEPLSQAKVHPLALHSVHGDTLPVSSLQADIQATDREEISMETNGNTHSTESPDPDTLNAME